MNNKITFPELVDAIAELTNTSKRVSESFLKELFGIVREKLEQGESVKIKNLGVFKVVDIASRKSVNVNTGEEMEIPAHKRVTFTPDKSLAEAINMPFEGFETVVLDDDLTDDELKELASTDDVAETANETSEAVVENDDTVEQEEPQPPVFRGEDEVSQDAEDSDEVEISVEENKPDAVAENVEDTAKEDDKEVDETEGSAEAIEPDNVDSEEYEDDEYEEETKREKRKSYFWGFLSGIVASIVIGCVAVAVCNSCFGFMLPKSDETTVVDEDDIEIADTVAVINAVQVKDDSVSKADSVKTEVDAVTPVAKTPAVVLDTVRVNNFLTKMSRRYYGRYEFWVYIYEENKAKIANPNKVEPGLVVVIPPAEKYGIDKNNPESVRKANELSDKIQKTVGNK